MILLINSDQNSRGILTELQQNRVDQCWISPKCLPWVFAQSQLNIHTLLCKGRAIFQAGPYSRLQKNPKCHSATGVWIAHSHAGQLLICSFSPHTYWAAGLGCDISPCSREEAAAGAAEYKEKAFCSLEGLPPSPIYKVFTSAPIATKDRKI